MPAEAAAYFDDLDYAEGLEEFARSLHLYESEPDRQAPAPWQRPARLRDDRIAGVLTMARRTITMPAKPPAPLPAQEVVPVKSAIRKAGTGGLRSAITSVFDKFFKAARTYHLAAFQSEKLRAPIDVGPNGENGEIPAMIARSRYAKANYAWYKQSMRQLANNTVGYGITPIITIPSLKKIWDLWVEETDARGRYDLYGLTWQVGETVPTDGAILVRFRNRFEDDMLSGVPFQLQLMEIDYLPIGHTQQASNGNWIMDGVERDAIERVVACWVCPVHPHDWRGVSNTLTPVRVPASEILHIFIPDRAIDAESDEPYDGEDATEPNFVNPPSGAAVEVPTAYQVKFPEMPAYDSNYEMFTRLNLSEIAVCIGLGVEQITWISRRSTTEPTAR